LIGTIDVKPPPVEGEAAPPSTAPDPRPGPGDRVTFVEQLTEEKLTPAPAARGSGLAARSGASPAPGSDPGAGRSPGSEPTARPPTSGAAGADPAAPGPESTHPARVYAIRPVTRGGRSGEPHRLAVPLVPLPPPPTDIAARSTEQSVIIEWKPPTREEEKSTVAFNVYGDRKDAAPLNPAPISASKFEVQGVKFGEERCFVVRTVEAVQNVAIESDPPEPACVTPKDIFPPAAPKGLQAVAAPDAIRLSWDANTEADLAGYLVLRGEAPGATLQPITPQPIPDPAYIDKAVTPGVVYVYAVIALDKATPAHASGPTERQEATAR